MKVRNFPKQSARVLQVLLFESAVFALARVAALMYTVPHTLTPAMLQPLEVFAAMRFAADFATCLACTFVCWSLGVLAWRLRGHIPFRTTVILLAVIMLGLGVRRAIDNTPALLMTQLGNLGGVAVRMFSSIVIAACSLLLVPIMTAMAEGSLLSAQTSRRLGACVDKPNFSFDSLSLDRSDDARTRSAEEELALAIERGEMRLFYQPQFSCRSGRVTGAEALVRWQHPTRGLLPPSEFIGLAEETGLIGRLGDWVLATACRDIACLNRQNDLSLKVAVNISARQIQEQDLPAIVATALTASRLPASLLELEITESVLIDSTPCTRERLEAVRAMGARLAIDDFGTGYSNFKYILDFAVDSLKIDRSFMAKCPGDPQAMTIVRTIIAMAHALNLEVIAEGVETESQRLFLSRRRCDEAQGYLWSPAVPLDQFTALVFTKTVAPHPDVMHLPQLTAALQ